MFELVVRTHALFYYVSKCCRLIKIKSARLAAGERVSAMPKYTIGCLFLGLSDSMLRCMFLVFVCADTHTMWMNNSAAI